MTSWTPQQRAFHAAVADASRGSICLDAKAGTGKTTTLVAALAPGDLAVAFNKRIAEELTARAPQGVVCKTMNGLGHSAWGGMLGRRRMTLNANKMGQIITEIIKAEGWQGHEDLWPDALKLCRSAKQNGAVPHGALGSPRALVEWDPQQACYDLDLEPSDELIFTADRALIKSIEMAWMAEIDFDDQLYMPVVYRAPFQRFARVFVDEAQDLNSIQHEMIARSVASSGRLIIVGDPHQSIYGFRGSINGSMGLLVERFSAEWLPLSVSFRCPKAVIRVAQRFVPDIEAHEDAPDGAFSIRSEWSFADLSAGDVIICRHNAPLIRTAFKMIREGISCFMLGRDIGAGLISTIRKALKVKGKADLSGFSIQFTNGALKSWAAEQAAKATAKRDDAKLQQIDDRLECIDAVIDLSGAETAQGLVLAIEQLFAPDKGKITLTSIHRAKGLEWARVWLLDPWRIGRKVDPETQPIEWQQEQNCFYVAVTRAKQELIYINEEDRK